MSWLTSHSAGCFGYVSELKKMRFFSAAQFKKTTQLKKKLPQLKHFSWFSIHSIMDDIE